MMRFKNADGRVFAVRILRKFDEYGDDDALIYESDEPSIEIYEATGFDGAEAEILGYFTGIRCLVNTLFLAHFVQNVEGNDEFAVWNISADNIESIKSWLLMHLTDDEKQTIQAPLIAKLPVEPSTQLANQQFAQPSISHDNTAKSVSPPVACCDAYTHSNSGQPFLQQELTAALQALDLAETAESHWKQGDIQVRLHIIGAKQQILQALAALKPLD